MMPNGDKWVICFLRYRSVHVPDSGERNPLGVARVSHNKISRAHECNCCTFLYSYGKPGRCSSESKRADMLALSGSVC